MILDDILVFFIMKSYFYFQRCRVCRISFLTFLYGILDIILTELEVDEFKA